jgi:broad specificity polyphosphatase/5'/3'-nucleotidase SurE
VLSGPNEGNNTGLITIHSGTVGAAVTAINKGYPAIALSGAGGVLPANPEVNAALSVRLVESLQASGGPLLPINTGLNVNLPAFAGCTSADDYKFVFTKIGISAQWGLKFYERLGDNPAGSQYVLPDYRSLPGVSGANPITAAGYPEDDDPASEQNALDSGVVTISVIEGTYQADAAKETIVQFKLRDLVSGLHPDFNGDGAVDIDDLVRLMESWGQDDPLADIAPPLGDGAVDVLDLEFLVGCWGEEIDDPTLVAHWALDEAEGMVAADSAGDHDGTVMGLPVWHPGGGQVDGALELTGMTFLAAGYVLNPSDGPFSVLAWVKGGLPGQVIVSQQNGANWLMADPLDGTLMTGLRSGGGSPGDLDSQALIADDTWHRIGFAWDGVYRRLYVDDVLVAEDAPGALEGSAGRQLIGCGTSMTPATYFTGLIDDVRIYDRAVRP